MIFRVTIQNVHGRYKGRLLAGSLRAWASRRSEAWERVFGPEEEILPGNDWSVCTLLERNREGGNVLRYRFVLQVCVNGMTEMCKEIPGAGLGFVFVECWKVGVR